MLEIENQARHELETTVDLQEASADVDLSTERTSQCHDQLHRPQRGGIQPQFQGDVVVGRIQKIEELLKPVGQEISQCLGQVRQEARDRPYLLAEVTHDRGNQSEHSAQEHLGLTLQRAHAEANAPVDKIDAGHMDFTANVENLRIDKVPSRLAVGEGGNRG